MFNKVLLLALTIGQIGSAQAVLIPLGAIGYSGLSVVSVPLPWSGAFSDNFAFSLKDGNGVQLGLTSSYFGATPADVPSITFELLGIGSFAPTVSATDDVFSAGALLTGLEQGSSYTLRISGSDSWNLGLSYALYIVPTMAVPEPDSIALQLSSLGLLALLTHRRQYKNGVPA
jgi:hypothetical protein